ncbi:MAG TPA: DUF6807 family protein, partial [Chitinophagaceae bacterium]|nr:DUF6807 family protein [Chitinophagaceae bacterium]
MRNIFLVAFICCALSVTAQDIQITGHKNVITQVRRSWRASSGYELMNRNTGRVIPAQLLDRNTLVFIAEEGTNTYTIRRSKKKFSSGITVDKTDSGLLVKVQNKPLFFYHTKEAMPPADSPAYYRRSGFIHPLYSPNGSILTDDFPAGHAHQHGIFTAWVNTTFRNQHLDFWNQHQKTGTVAHVKILSIEEGPVFTRIKTKLHHISLTAGPVLEEIWTITVYPFTDNFLFDLESAQVNITSDTLFLNQYHYGGLAFRGSKEWNRHDTAHFRNDWQLITDEGQRNASANATHARWVDASGKLNGQISGV